MRVCLYLEYLGQKLCPERGHATEEDDEIRAVRNANGELSEICPGSYDAHQRMVIGLICR